MAIALMAAAFPLKKSKRGIFFTLIAIILITIAIAAFLSSSEKSMQQSQAIATRVRTLDSFLEDMQRDMERALFISSFRGILGLEQYILDKGQYVDDTETAFESAIFNGTYYNTTLAIVQNATLAKWINLTKQQAQKIDVIVEIKLINSTIVHVSPWEVQSTATANISLTDKNNLASFNKTHTAASKFSIKGFEDPIYPVNTFGRVINIVNETNFTYFVNGTNTSNLKVHSNNSWYIAHADAPNFLMRLEGSINTSSQHGIESLVNTEELSSQGISIHTTRTVVDYLYFGNDTVKGNCITNMPSWFKIDDNHLETYEVENLVC